MSIVEESPVVATVAGIDNFTVSTATLEDWRVVTEWGNAEGWNIGYRDPACFHATDPGGFFIGRLDGRPVSAVSLVNHSEDYAVWGHYLVDPEFRGQGYGRATREVARRHAGRRVLACDTIPEQVENYRRSGLVPVYDTINYVGRPVRATAEGFRVRCPAQAAASSAEVFCVGPEHLDTIAAYDSESFPAYRRTFLSQWLSAEGHTGYALACGGEITGYGVIRPAPLCHRIGPLIADTLQEAGMLFDLLTGHLGPGDEVSVFAPGLPGVDSFFAARGLKEQFRVVRMYEGEIPQTRNERVFAISCLELG